MISKQKTIFYQDVFSTHMSTAFSYKKRLTALSYSCQLPQLSFEEKINIMKRNT